MDYYLAIDIGASSGRHILASIQDGKIRLEEIYRFKNEVKLKDSHYFWDIDNIYHHILLGLEECIKENKVPKTLAIDTWAVDYVLLDQEGNRLNEIYSYRDSRVDSFINENITEQKRNEIYQKTGIQYQKFNTIYQLASDNMKDDAVDFLMVPDYLNYLLTGKKVNEYTNMSTTQLLNITTNSLDEELLNLTGFSKKIFQSMVMPGFDLGKVNIGLDIDTRVIVPSTHDTGSAYMASIESDSIILSSGTWSLLGVETKKPIISDKSQKANFTNEGGYEHHYRFLKNIMGLWVIQEVARMYKSQYGYDQLVQMARRDTFNGIFDVNDDRFLKPKNMIEEIKNDFKERDELAPETPGQIAYCVYNSLAYCYKKAISELEDITGKTYATINIIGGGCQNELLNEMIAKQCHKKVVAGPVEATALGNIMVQLIGDGVINNLNEGRKMIKESFQIKEYRGE